mgnify:CR=1 FL=1
MYSFRKVPFFPFTGIVRPFVRKFVINRLLSDLKQSSFTNK